MENSSFEKIRHSFDAFCKKVLRDAKVDYLRQMSRRTKRELPISDLICEQLPELQIIDEYSITYEQFRVLCYDIEVRNLLLGEALKHLPEHKRNVILMSFFLDMNDTEIAQEMKMVRSTIYYHRITSRNEDAIEKIMKYYEGYIAVLSRRVMYDGYGNACYCIDEELRERLTSKLLEKILAFNIA